LAAKGAFHRQGHQVLDVDVGVVQEDLVVGVVPNAGTLAPGLVGDLDTTGDVVAGFEFGPETALGPEQVHVVGVVSVVEIPDVLDVVSAKGQLASHGDLLGPLGGIEAMFHGFAGGGRFLAHLGILALERGDFFLHRLHLGVERLVHLGHLFFQGGHTVVASACSGIGQGGQAEQGCQGHG